MLKRVYRKENLFYLLIYLWQYWRWRLCIFFFRQVQPVVNFLVPSEQKKNGTILLDSQLDDFLCCVYLDFFLYLLLMFISHKTFWYRVWLRRVLVWTGSCGALAKNRGLK